MAKQEPYNGMPLKTKKDALAFGVPAEDFDPEIHLTKHIDVIPEMPAPQDATPPEKKKNE
jgi:hypothetical protein